MSILKEIGTVLINGIISQVHAEIILGKETQVCGVRRKRSFPLPLCTLPWALGLKEKEKEEDVLRLTYTGKKEEERRGTLHPGA